MNEHPPVGLIPTPPPAPTVVDGMRAWLRQPAVGGPVRPPVQDAPQQPAQPTTEPTPQPAAQPAPQQQHTLPAAKKKNGLVYGLIVGGVIAGGVAAAMWIGRDSTPPGPSPIEQQLATLSSQVSTLAAQPATGAAAVEVNPLSAMPCAVTNDARRFIGVDLNGQLGLQPSIRVSTQVYDLVRSGARYETLVVRTGVSITQLEVDSQGRGVQLFDCGAAPASAVAPTATTIAPPSPVTAPAPAATS